MSEFLNRRIQKLDARVRMYWALNSIEGIKGYKCSQGDWKHDLVEGAGESGLGFLGDVVGPFEEHNLLTHNGLAALEPDV